MDEHDKKILKRFCQDYSDRDIDLAMAHNNLWHFCNTLFPKFFKDNREYLTDMCDRIENFVERSDKHFLVINAPPRHGKSLTAQCLTAWLFGQNPAYRVMTASYNEDVAGIFSRNVRNTIQTEKMGDRIVFSDIFPRTAVKFGEAAAKRWTLKGQSQVSYLATSPNATATGFGCDFLICDDLIKNAEEAYNEMELDKTWSWFTDTMLSRLEGKRKTIIIMTRWAENDLAGHIISAFADDVEVITYKAQDENGKMLCDDILDAKSFAFIKQEMSVDIAEANYNQTPIDVKGRLYSEFKTWEVRPQMSVIYDYTDTADTGEDFLASVVYGVYENEAYVLDLVFTDEPMETTEPAVAKLLTNNEVNKATIESNNGGRGFARNVARLMQEMGNHKTQVVDQAQTRNKESRILASSAWVQNHIYMPLNWRTRYPEFYKQVMSYQRKGKNAHDDAVDVLAAIYEAVANTPKAKIYTDADLGRAAAHRRAPFMR